MKRINIDRTNLKELKRIKDTGKVTINSEEIKAIFNALESYKKEPIKSKEFIELLESLRTKFLMLWFHDNAKIEYKKFLEVFK